MKTKAEIIAEVELFNTTLSKYMILDRTFVDALSTAALYHKLHNEYVHVIVNTAHLILTKEGKPTFAIKEVKRINAAILKKINSITLAKYYTLYGSIYQTQYVLPKAIEFYNLSISALKSEKAKDPKILRRLMVNNYNLSVLFLTLKDYKQTKKYLVEAHKIAIKLSDDNYLANCHFQWNGYYYFLKDYDSAKTHIREAIEYYKKTNNVYRLGLSYNNLAGIELETNDYNSALENCMYAYKFLKKNNPNHNLTIELNNIGKCYMALRQYPESKKWILLSYKESQKENNINHKKQSVKSMWEYYLAMKSYKEALRFQQEYYQLELQLNDLERSKNLLEVEQKFKSIEKEKELKLRKAKQAEANKYLKQLTQKNETLKEFSYALAHDLKEPIRSTRSFINIIEKKVEDSSSAMIFEMMYRNLNGMQNLITDILDMTKIDIDETKKEFVNLDELMRKIKENLSAQIQDKKAVIKYNNLGSVKFIGNQAMQVFQNLISNGIKYNESKVPTIQITTKKSGSKTLITISDNGIGIPEEAQKGVFGLFKRAHADKYEGTGVGLAICKRIVEKNDGEIRLVSEVGKGSRMEILV